MMKEELKNNKDYYPTPKRLFKKMFAKVKNWDKIKTILEPSAGSGTLCEYLKEEFKYRRIDVVVIEKDESLQKELVNKNYRLIDSDFLTYDNSVQCDLIFANLPFSEGDKHLLKAIDILYSGEIVALINAETLKNPYSNIRKELALKLKQLNANITFLKNEFTQSDRKTDVEIALVHIQKNVSFESELNPQLEKDLDVDINLNQEFDIANYNDILNLVKLYEREKNLVSNHLIEFYKNYHIIGHIMNIEIQGIQEESTYRNSYYDEKNLTQELKEKLNQLNSSLKKTYWSKLIKEDRIVKSLTSKKKKELKAYISKFYNFAFNESNIQIVMKNIIEKFSSSIDEAILELFDVFTRNSLKDSRWTEDEYKANVHYYNAWKSNESYKVNKKVIVRFYHASRTIIEKRLYWEEQDLVTDIHRVVSYFDRTKGDDPVSVIDENLKDGITKKIKVNNLLFSFFKKGTMHIEFLDSDVLRKFNIAVGKLRGDLPMDYSEKEYQNLNKQELSLVQRFENNETNYKPIPRYSNEIKLLE